MEATASFVILLSVVFMFGGDREGFLLNKMKPELKKECATKVDADAYSAVDIAFDNMMNGSELIDLQELAKNTDENYAKEVCRSASPLFDSIGSFIIATRPCLSGAYKTKSHSLYALNKSVWGFVCSESDFRSALNCYAEKEMEMANCFRGFQGVYTSSPEERTESCKEFKADMECSLKILQMKELVGGFRWHKLSGWMRFVQLRHHSRLYSRVCMETTK